MVVVEVAVAAVSWQEAGGVRGICYNISAQTQHRRR
ncbi:hypothetical protein E2C01_068019 [Portunus trituberculatus]|uniref:Uncharacterized protein n=1 Tax=Portunus trituberculatus TaxID=210409 RepID=A0A5B7HUP2_PORTR|nr:hypothetical protein [Portunus trituberculatus]